MKILTDEERYEATSRAQGFNDIVERGLAVFEIYEPLCEPKYLNDIFLNYYKTSKIGKKISRAVSTLGILTFLYGCANFSFAIHSAATSQESAYKAREEKRSIERMLYFTPKMYNSGIDTTQLNIMLRNDIQNLDSKISELENKELQRKKYDRASRRSNYLLGAGAALCLLGLSIKPLFQKTSRSTAKKKLIKLTSKPITEAFASLELPDTIK